MHGNQPNFLERDEDMNVSPKGQDYSHLPTPWKTGCWSKYTDEVSVDWLLQFKGNSLRRDHESMNVLKEEICSKGLVKPLLLIVGLTTKKLYIGEGNHRLEVFRSEGWERIPTRIWIKERASNADEHYPSLYYPYLNLPNDPFFYNLSIKPSRIIEKYEVIYPQRC